MSSVVRYENEFGVWLKDLMHRHRIGARQVTIRTDVSHTTVEDIVKRGRRPTVETAMKLALGFGESVPEALKLAAYPEIAEAWETGAAPVLDPPVVETREPFMDDIIEAGYSLPTPERKEVLEYIRFRLQRAQRHGVIGARTHEDEEKEEGEMR